MKTCIAILFFFFAAKTATAQNAKIDSLDRLISMANTDTGKIKLMVKKIDVLSTINLDTAISFAMQTLEAAKKINYYKGEVNVRQDLASDYCYKGEYKAAEEHLKFLEHFIKPSKDSFDLADVYGNFGMMYGMQSKYDSAIYFYQKSIGIRERAGNTKSLAPNYSNIAISYQQQSNFPQALFYQQKALKIAEGNKDEVNQAYTNMNMANTYDSMGDSLRAEQTYLKAIRLAKKTELINVELYAYSNLASMYVKQNKWQQVYEFAMKAAALGGSMGDKGIEAASMSKAATALAHMGKSAEAEALANKAIEIADSSSQPLNIYQAFSAMGSILRLKGSYAAAIPYFEKAVLLMRGSDMFTVDNGTVYSELSECYEKTANYRKALENYKIATQINDSTRSKNNIQKATELTMNYEFEKKQQVQQAQQKAKDDVARARQLALIMGLVLTLVLAAVAFIGFKNKQKANALLKNQKGEIENTLNLLKSTQSQLIQSEKMASLGELTAGIAHEIQNPLNFINNFSEINTELIEELQNELKAGNKEEAVSIAGNIKENEGKINHHGKRADAIVKGMLQHSQMSTGLKEPVNINALADEYLRLAYHGLRAKDKSFNVTMQTEFDEGLKKIKIVRQDIGRVFLNLFNNAFYSVNEKRKRLGEMYNPVVFVSTKRMAAGVEVTIKDNGGGIPEKVFNKIFQPFFTTKPTGQGTGLGLSLSYDIITKEHAGSIRAETAEEEGAAFVIQLPGNE
jgi:two-component system, NtrC family, sensor kinase